MWRDSLSLSQKQVQSAEDHPARHAVFLGDHASVWLDSEKWPERQMVWRQQRTARFLRPPDGAGSIRAGGA